MAVAAHVRNIHKTYNVSLMMVIAAAATVRTRPQPCARASVGLEKNPGAAKLGRSPLNLTQHTPLRLVLEVKGVCTFDLGDLVNGLDLEAEERTGSSGNRRLTIVVGHANEVGRRRLVAVVDLGQRRGSKMDAKRRQRCRREA